MDIFKGGGGMVFPETPTKKEGGGGKYESKILVGGDNSEF